MILRPKYLSLALLVLLALQAGSQAITFTTLAPLQNAIGSQPVATLLSGQDGRLYGTASQGGASGLGSIFVFKISGNASNLVSFSGANGAHPLAPVSQMTNGDLVGTTFSGGASDLGTVFRVRTNGTFVWSTSFTGANGANPQGNLLPSTNNTFLGTTTHGGGTNDGGTVFSVDADGNLTTLARFGGTNGASPMGSLVRAADGAIFGTTSSEGQFARGTVFRITPAGLVEVLHSFQGAADGAGPQGGLTMGPGGLLYGTTAGGGTNDTATGGDGTIFSITPAGVFTTLYMFTNTIGAQPFATLLPGLNGSLLGTTALGGTSHDGAIFAVTTAGVVTNIYSFHGGTDGASPKGGLTLATNGNFYGVTSAKGKNNDGTIFSLSAVNPFVVTQSVNQTFVSGSTVTFSVAAGGSAPLAYQWQLNSTNLTDNSRIIGSRTASLTITDIRTADAGNYTVVVQNAGGAVTSAVMVLAVTEHPTLKITSPKQNATVTKLPLTVSGTTGGAVGVSQVFYRLNSTNSWQLASSSDGFLHWTATVTPPPGTNVLEAYAQSIITTFSTTNRVSFLCDATSAPISLIIVGQGSVSPIQNNQLLQIGTTYIATAKPAKGWLFTSWTSTNGAISQTTPKLSFVMESNLVLIATFTEKPYEEVQGKYRGLFDVPEDHEQNSSGLATLSVAENGKVSGTLLIGAAHYSFRGALDESGAATIAIHRKNAGDLVVTLQADLSPGPHHILGSVTDGNFSADLDMVKAVFSAKSNPAPLAGQYTFYFPGDPANATVPGGNSYGTLRIDGSGNVRVGASLADGTTVSASTILSVDGMSPLYVPLYHGQGSLYAWLGINSSSNSPIDAFAIWLKSTTDAAKFYPGPFAVTNQLFGSKYARLPNGTSLPATTGDYSLTLTGDGLGADISLAFQITASGHVAITGITNAAKASLSFSGSSGTFKGTVSDKSAGLNLKFGGAVLQNVNSGSGYFPGFDRQTGPVTLLPSFQ
jgi:uncharacterized repeat protein (TIGR03803 family)